MTDENKTFSCTLQCWALAALAGVITVVLCLVIGKMAVMAALFFGVVLAVVLGALMGWLFCKPLPPLASSVPAPKPVEPVATPAAPQAAPETVKAENTTSAPQTEAIIQPSAELPGQADLASRKGSWTYQSGAGSETDAPVGDATQPQGLDAPRQGGADDLKQIKGVGPKLEQLLNSLGFFHFDQIAGWSAAEIAWVDDNLKGFKGRATRDDWIGQAKILASGGETAFSKRVEDGGVY